MTEIEKSPDDPGRFLMADLLGKPALGAFVPDQREELTIFWCGKVHLSELSTIIRSAEDLFAEAGGEVVGYLTGFGSEKKKVGPSKEIEKFLAPNSSFADYDAYKAEITGRSGKISVWANVREPEPIALEDGGDNIGLSLPPHLFYGPGRSLVRGAIMSTMRLHKKAAETLLDQIANGVRPRPEPA